MPASNNITRYHYVVFLLWLCLTLVAAIYFIGNRLILFDPLNKLSGKGSSVIIENIKQNIQLSSSMSGSFNLSNTIIHFTSDNCSCTQFSKDHKVAINDKAIGDAFRVINIKLPEESPIIIPSTPSILIVNKAEELLYFGPYSAGLACSESNGYVETVLQNYANGFNSNLIINDVKGCYCNI